MKNKTARRQLVGLLLAIALEFTLGTILTTLIDYDPTKSSSWQNFFLISHIALALAILVGGFVQLVMTIRAQAHIGMAGLGLLAIMSSLASGSVAAQNGNDIATFIMAVSFLATFMAYGYLLLKLPAESK